MTPSEIITALTKEQASQGIKDIAICETAQIHRSTLWRLKKEQTPATLDQITAICEVLGYKLAIVKK